MSQKYQNVQQFIEDCNLGEDIEFAYHGIGYGVFGWYPGGPLAYRKDAFGYYEQQFDDANAVLDGFQIEGQPLRNRITEIEND